MKGKTVGAHSVKKLENGMVLEEPQSRKKKKQFSKEHGLEERERN